MTQYHFRYAKTGSCLSRFYQRLDTFSKPRMLAEYEIKLLRQSKKKIGEAVRKRFKEQSL